MDQVLARGSQVQVFSHQFQQGAGKVGFHLQLVLQGAAQGPLEQGQTGENKKDKQYQWNLQLQAVQLHGIGCKGVTSIQSDRSTGWVSRPISRITRES